MKVQRVSSVLLIVMLAVVLSACGKPDKKTQQLIDDIAALGEYNLSQETYIQELVDSYEALSDKQKKQVSNYATLEQAQKAMGNLKVVKNIERSQYDTIEYAVQQLANTLILPATMQIKDIVMCIAGDTKILYIQADAANMNGEIRTGTYYYNVQNGIVEDTNDYEEYKNYSMNGNKQVCYRIKSGFYSNQDDITNPAEAVMIFTVDLQDFEEQGYYLTSYR